MPRYCSLHIGLNKVDPVHYLGWDGQLQCCENDALFYSEMAEKSGITERTLLLSTGREGSMMPTCANLDKLLTQYSQQLVDGDRLLITYSGHGGQIEDKNFDEKDGLDETWCLYDRQYLDDELWTHFNSFAKGVQIIVFSDSCHSGTIIRAIAETMEASNSNGPLTREAPKEFSYGSYAAHKDQYYEATHLPVVEKSTIDATVLSFSACSDNELACEADGFGAFTAVVRNVWTDLKGISWESLYQEIVNRRPAKQHPELEVLGSAAATMAKESAFLFNAMNNRS